MNNMANLLDKPWHLQLLVFGLGAAILYGGFWYFVIKGTSDETAEINQQVEQLQQANAASQAASQRINEVRATYARAQADYADLVALLPEQRELTNVLQGVQDRARGQLSLRRFTPKDDFQQDFYSGKPIEIEITGTYNRLGQFFAQMAAYQRIVSITDFNIKGMDDQKAGTIDGQFTLTAYYVSPEQLQAKQSAKPVPKQPANSN
ncbi:MAG: type 4a pilus biogenesis protein PilO [Acidobacteriota bacterium]|nr:type 4a pilus biogenesis protein PilO [Acidobacteriota bacterium]